MVNQKQKKLLKSMAHHLNPVILIGKDGVYDNVIASTDEALFSHQLIKVHVANTCATSVNEVALELSVATKATIIQIIGRVIVLYLPSKDRKQWLV